MNIEKPSKLTKKQLSEMDEIVKICAGHDAINAELQVDESFKAPEDVNAFLLYADGALISFITLFAPSKSEVELSAFTLPQFRQQGFFSKLHKEAVTEIQSRGTKEILYVCDRKSADGQSAVKHTGAVYDFSEYSMIFSGNKQPVSNQTGGSIRVSVPEDADQLVQIALRTSEDTIEDARNYIKMIFAAENRSQHVAIIDEKIVGMISTAVEGSKSYIHGLCVLPEYQKRGIGSTLLKIEVQESLLLHPEYEIKLEVMTENRKALSIYEQAGFNIRTCYDYFKKSYDI